MSSIASTGNFEVLQSNASEFWTEETQLHWLAIHRKDAVVLYTRIWKCLSYVVLLIVLLCHQYRSVQVELVVLNSAGETARIESYLFLHLLLA